VAHEDTQVQRGERETRTENLVRMDGDDDLTVPPSSMFGWNASKPVDLAVGARECRRI